MCWGLYRAAYLLRPALVVPLCPVSCGPCVFCVVFGGVAGSCWPFVFAVVFSSVALVCSAFGVWGCFGLAHSLLASFPLLPAPSVSPLVPLVQSVFCWSLPLGIWLYLRRPGCHACGMVCCDGLAPVPISSWQRLRPCVGLCPLHIVASALPVPFLPALRYLPLVIQIPPQDAARAACALLLGLCCFLPPVLAAFPGALSVLLLLASACCLPPRPCSFFGFLCPLRCRCVFWCVVCCPFVLASCCGCWFCFCLVFLVCSSRFVVGFVGCASCQLTKVTKDC